MTYALFSLAVVLLTVAVTYRTLRRVGWRTAVTLGAFLVALTAVFDNVLVGIGIVDYDPDRILGIRVPFAPIEDFSYTLAVVMLMPAIWTWLARLAPQPTATSGATKEQP